ncbi:DNA mismatch repair endonuclease MutL, partial [bacterium]|nr:DNA mismatch repair endonuclease MutL [bacterium]
MGKVNFLPEEVINKIAAGEVVERPASVLKELVENSIDAKAENISVEVKNGGKKLIIVKDDGEGIEPDDIEKIFMRHATSKIKDIEDLYKITSLGFRGEALYSVGAVSDVILKSRVDHLEEGREIHIRGGKKISMKTVNMRKGTTVEVRELFFNTPARRKFLKSDQTEFRHILNIFIPYTIVWSDIKFSLIHNGKEIIKLFPYQNLTSRFSEVLNVEEENLIYEEAEIPEFKVKLKLILGNLNLKRPNKNLQFIFVNKRPVYNYSISSSLNDVYRTVLPDSVFPVFAVMIEIPSEMVDVNIHPTKREVKIKDEKKLSLKISEIVAKLIVEKGRPSRVEKIKKEVVFYKPEIEKKIEVKEGIGEKSIFEELKEGREKEERESYREKLKEAIYVGIFKKKYIFFEYGNSLFVIDQHAAHER